MELTVEEKMAALRAPFPKGVVSFKPQSVKGNRALAVAYIASRDVMDRLDEVLTPKHWQTEYNVLSDGCVVCYLRVRFEEGGEWLTKSDVGSPSEQPDGGDRLKASFSDALKRAAVQWGIGRFLYSLPLIWHDYDPVKKQFVTDPPLPPQFVAPAKGNRPSPPVANTSAPPPTTNSATTGTQQPSKDEPQNGQELRKRIAAKDKELADAGKIQAGGLLHTVTTHGFNKKWDNVIDNWTQPQIAEATKVAKDWIGKLPK